MNTKFELCFAPVSLVIFDDEKPLEDMSDNELLLLFFCSMQGRGSLLLQRILEEKFKIDGQAALAVNVYMSHAIEQISFRQQSLFSRHFHLNSAQQNTISRLTAFDEPSIVQKLSELTDEYCDKLVLFFGEQTFCTVRRWVREHYEQTQGIDDI